MQLDMLVTLRSSDRIQLHDNLKQPGLPCGRNRLLDDSEYHCSEGILLPVVKLSSLWIRCLGVLLLTTFAHHSLVAQKGTLNKILMNADSIAIVKANQTAEKGISKVFDVISRLITANRKGNKRGEVDSLRNPAFTEVTILNATFSSVTAFADTLRTNRLLVDIKSYKNGLATLSIIHYTTLHNLLFQIKEKALDRLLIKEFGDGKITLEAK